MTGSRVCSAKPTIHCFSDNDDFTEDLKFSCLGRKKTRHKELLPQNKDFL